MNQLLSNRVLLKTGPRRFHGCGYILRRVKKKTYLSPWEVHFQSARSFFPVAEMILKKKQQKLEQDRTFHDGWRGKQGHEARASDILVWFKPQPKMSPTWKKIAYKFIPT